MPKRLVTGLTSNGDSCIVDETIFGLTLHGARNHEAAQHLLFDAPCLTVPVVETGLHLDLGVPPGGVQWSLIYGTADQRGITPMHHTDSFELVTVLDGAVSLVLDVGEYLLAVGDCVVQTGANHTWRAGPGGYTMLIAILGTDPAKSDRI